MLDDFTVHCVTTATLGTKVILAISLQISFLSGQFANRAPVNDDGSLTLTCIRVNIPTKVQVCYLLLSLPMLLA